MTVFTQSDVALDQRLARAVSYPQLITWPLWVVEVAEPEEEGEEVVVAGKALKLNVCPRVVF